jgi:hypothetical protein
MDTMAEGAERGQASVELVAGVPVLLLAAVAALQLLVCGYCSTLADGAAEAAALAAAGGRSPQEAVQAALPGWARGRVELQRSGGRIAVALRPPSLLEPLGGGLEVTSSAWVRPRADG